MKRFLAGGLTGLMVATFLLCALGMNVNAPQDIYGYLKVHGFGIFDDSVGVRKTLDVAGCATFWDTLKVRYAGRFNEGWQAGGQRVTKMLTGTFTLDVGSISANSTRDETFTVTGLNSSANWAVIVKPNSTALNTGVSVGDSRVSADNTLQIRFVNLTGGAIDPVSQTFSYIAFRQ